MRQAKVAIWFAFIVCTTSVASAQDTTGQASTATDAREAFRRGEAAYSAGNYETAIREWKAAYAADPRPRIQFNLSQAYERLGQLQNAIAALELFLQSGDPDDPTFSDANARLVALRQRLSQTGVVVKGGPEGGEILVDDQDWGRTPRPDRIFVSPGSHTLVVRWPARPDFRTNIVVAAGQVVEVTIPDTPSGSATTATVTPVDGSVGGDAQAPAPRKDRRLLWYSLGAGAAAAGGGLLVYGIARGAATNDCDNADLYCDPNDVEAADRQSVAGYAVGGTLLAAGAALFVVGALTGRGQESQASAACGLGWASATCRFHF